MHRNECIGVCFSLQWRGAGMEQMGVGEVEKEVRPYLLVYTAAV